MNNPRSTSISPLNKIPKAQPRPKNARRKAPKKSLSPNNLCRPSLPQQQPQPHNPQTPQDDDDPSPRANPQYNPGMRRSSLSLRPFARALPARFARLTDRFAVQEARESSSASGLETSASPSPLKDSPSPPSTAPPTSTNIPPPGLHRRAPFYLDTGTSLFAKRAPRPFPPPFLSPPTTSFSDALSTHQWSWDRRKKGGKGTEALIGGEKVGGVTNGDDAVVVGEGFVGVCDGVGAWSTRKGGHAGLWSRLIVHFWAAEIERAASTGEEPTPIEYLQRAYEQTLEATTQPTEWQGTTTATGAQLHYESTESDGSARPVLYVTNLGDSQVLVLRPRNSKVIFKTEAQWHWFDCPRQLGTNSPDTPRGAAVVNKVVVEVGDVVLAVSDGVTDNLWEHEVVSCVVSGMKEWEDGGKEGEAKGRKGEMQFVADKLMNAARVIAQDPFAESPFMEHAIEEGLAMEGGKLDDISVVVGLIKKNVG
ncbi:hypothetical protein V497_04174 [Pseudogymnoascus sp. VKM F-4516 (FW-969)]|nr:hypothetical protein V497_04174 [Pseudogymnoascus sp. VKM F-4516 (FW-969)]